MHNIPFAERIRPKELESFFGQEHIISVGSELYTYFKNKNFPSIIFWGPPGSGKTTLAYLISKTRPEIPFFCESAVKIGVKRIREIAGEDRTIFAEHSSVILFLDEIHRFNKAQQDVLLPYIEKGNIILIGATTENPSFYLTSPLLSRTRLFILKPLMENDIEKIIERSLNFIEKLSIDKYSIKIIAESCDGDARQALNIVEALSKMNKNINKENISKYINKVLLYDKKGDYFYDLISAFHKSVRSSDPQATLYYLARMLVSGCDPAYILRRMIRIASEDIGLADPQALVIATQTREAFDNIGMPEAELAIVESAVYLSTAPKSNSLYIAWQKALQTVKESGSIPVPIHLRNAPTKLAKKMGHGKEYKYDHDFQYAFSGQETMPDKLKNKQFYSPNNRGFEKEIKKRIDFWEKLKNNTKE